MTAEELLAACREAWPDGATGWGATDLGAERAIASLATACIYAHRAHGVSGEVLTRAGHAGRAHTGDHSPAGVREVVSRLRAWCREEALRMLEEVTPRDGWESGRGG